MDYVLIVAGGKGLRMGTDIPKQFLLIEGKPILMRTLEAFYTYNQDMHIILVLPHEGCARSIVFQSLTRLQTGVRRVFIRYATAWLWWKKRGW